jgi:hypothetical protein
MAADYVALIRQRERHDLLAMLELIGAGLPIEGWPGGSAFEHLVLRAFEIEGADVTWTYRVQLAGETVEQIDGAVFYQHLACLVESKDCQDAVNVEPIAKVRSQLLRRPPGTLGLVFARSGFTESAKLLTRMLNPVNILLWEFEELEAGLRTGRMCSSLVSKYRYAVERGLPDYDVRMDLR